MSRYCGKFPGNFYFLEFRKKDHCSERSETYGTETLDLPNLCPTFEYLFQKCAFIDSAACHGILVFHIFPESVRLPVQSL